MEHEQEKYNGGNVANSVLKVLQDEVVFLRNLVIDQGTYIKTLLSIFPRGTPDFRNSTNTIGRDTNTIGTIGQQIHQNVAQFPVEKSQQLPGEPILTNTARADREDLYKDDYGNSESFIYPKRYAPIAIQSNSWSPDLRNSFAGLPIEPTIAEDSMHRNIQHREIPTTQRSNAAASRVYITEKEVANSQSYDYKQGREKVTIIGDSLLHRAQKWRLNEKTRNCSVRKFTIPGYTARDLYTCVDAELTDPGRKADTVIINAGSNDLANDRFISPKVVSERVAALAKKCTDYGVNKVMISPIIPRKGIEARRKEKNRLLKIICEESKYIYIENSDISWHDLHTDKTHLNREGLTAMEDILILYINNDYEKFVDIDCLSVNSASHGNKADPSHSDHSD